jgi:hypothetical protein
MKKHITILILLCSISAQAQIQTFHPNEYRDFTPQQKPSNVRKLRTVASTYKITRTKIVGWSLIAVGSAFDGLLEGYLHDGRTSFERKWNVSKTGFWGSESWRFVYVGGNPEKGFKSDFIRWTGAFCRRHAQNWIYHRRRNIRHWRCKSKSKMVALCSRLWHFVCRVCYQ